MTSTDLANQTLDHLGIPSIDSIDTVGDEVSEKCKGTYEQTRKAYLREAAPGFAKLEVDLALASGETSSKYDYVYAEPADSLKLRNIYSSDPQTKIPYEMASHSSKTSNVITTDKEDAVMFYTVDKDNLDTWPPDDILALSYFWAMKLAMPLKKDRNLMNDNRTLYLGVLAMSQKNNKREQHTELPDDDKYINARR